MAKSGLSLLRCTITCLSICGATPSPAADIAYQGTHILTRGAFQELATAFEKKTGVVVLVKGGGCADGIAVVLNDKREMGGICCPLNPDQAAHLDLMQHRVAVDVKAVVVHPKNPVRNLTLKQVAEIHAGWLTNWRTAGGKDRPIALVYRDHCRDMEEPVRRVLGITGPVAKKAIIVQTDKEIVDYVERFPDAIGVVSRIFAEEAQVKMVAVDGVEPTLQNAGGGRYPLMGDLFVITRGNPGTWTDKFIAFVLGKDGQAIIGKRFVRAK